MEEQIEVEETSMIRKVFGWILRAPLILLVLISWGASWVAASQKISGVTYSVPIVYTVFVILYIIGIFMLRD